MCAPEETLQIFLEQRSFGQACIGYFTAALSWVLFFNIASGVPFPLFLLKLGLVFAAELTIGFVWAAFCGLLLDLLRVETSSAKLFTLVGSAGFIKGLLIAFALISAASPTAHMDVLAPLAVLLVLVLQLGYLIRSLKRIYGVSYSKAFCVWLFSLVPIAVAVGLFGTFLVWGLVLLF